MKMEELVGGNGARTGREQDWNWTENVLWMEAILIWRSKTGPEQGRATQESGITAKWEQALKIVRDAKMNCERDGER